ncbi:hypothetical protein DPMN_070537 [Dreissena polymorpha]|uniref:Uncharacterized protein n=1 Tax=Dreissena polymorpha TaxID=45954 RepID=A0A9D3Z0Y3_DREPO|nr:hypothetical protein DPMN_070537 [Dreissena polymorpha]
MEEYESNGNGVGTGDGLGKTFVLYFRTRSRYQYNQWAKIVTSRVFTRNIAPPPGGHLNEDWASNVTSTVFTSFELSRCINWTNVLTKFHEDLIINVDSRVFRRQNVDDARRTKGDHKSSP